MSVRQELERQFFDMLMESQYWPAEQMVEHQRGQLSQLLRHAKANVPFYEERLNAVVKANGDIDWSRWDEIPIVKRRDLVDHSVAMQAAILPKGHGPVGSISSSGSTGLAITVSTPALMRIPHAASVWRCHVWNDFDWSKSYCSRESLKPGEGAWPEGKYAGKWGPSWFGGPRGDIWRVSKDTSPADTLEFIARHGCGYFNTSPKTARAMALEAERLGIRLSLDALLAQGEHVDDADRIAIKRMFGAPVVEHYSSKEGSQMAHPCSHGRLHINSEVVLLEVLDDQGRQCGLGETGRIVVTPLHNTAQPLIRYEQGDIAIVGSCDCGRTLPVLDSIVGRTSALFRHPDGRVVSRLLPLEYRKLIGCEFWQIAQVGPTDFEVRYVPLLGSTTDEAAFVAAFRRTYFEDAQVRLVKLDSLPFTPAGKFIEYVNEVAPS